MQRKTFIRLSALSGMGLALSPYSRAATTAFPTVRVSAAERKFSSPAIENVIKEISNNIGNKELAWLFNNCFPNTLDTTVDCEMVNGKPDTYVITGDIDAMWLRDSSAQVWPYIPLAMEDPKLKQLLKGVIYRQTKCILKDPYANAFYKDENRVSEWKETDITDMQPGIHERKWEIDSLCYPIRLAYGYWKETGDTSAFDKEWEAAMHTVIRTFREQQRFEDKGPYSFQRVTSWATDGVPLAGYGYPTKPNGLICSTFRPSDDATVFAYLIPSNFFAVASLNQMAEIAKASGREQLAAKASALSDQVAAALKEHASVQADGHTIYAYEIDGFGSRLLMDDANVPSLLSLPYLGAVPKDDPIYQQTRTRILTTKNPFYFAGTAGEGIGSPHTGLDRIWHIGIIMRALTSQDDKEIKLCLDMLESTHAGTGFMHESFMKNDASDFTRKWFAWANTLFGEMIWHVYRNKKQLLN